MSTTRDTAVVQAPVESPSTGVRTAATIGLAGAALSFVAWALMLGDPASGTPLWYAGNGVGQVAMVGTTVLVLGLFAVRETGRPGTISGATGRSFLALWALGLILLHAGGIESLVTGEQDSILFPIGGITAGLAALVSSIFIASNKALRGSPRRWAPLIFSVGSFLTGFFQGEGHSLRINLADLAGNLLLLLLAGAFFLGVRATPQR
jgi:hypothetical protein